MFSYTDHSNLGTVKEIVVTVITALPMLLQVMQMIMVMPLQSHGEWSGASAMAKSTVGTLLS